MIVLDFEASALTGYPIEIAWGSWPQDKITSRLIRPEPSWLSMPWDEDSGRLHGIPRSSLSSAPAAASVALEVATAAAGNCLYSDSDYDQKWLTMLLAAADLAPLPIADLDRALASILGLEPPSAIDQALAFFTDLGRTRQAAASIASEIAPIRHRAAADVAHHLAMLDAALSLHPVGRSRS